MRKFVERILGQPDSRVSALEPAADAGRARPFVPNGRRLYCIGDIHGRLDLLEELHQQIRRDAQGFNGSKRVIYLGDYIDRGSQSKQVLDLFMGFLGLSQLGGSHVGQLGPRTRTHWSR